MIIRVEIYGNMLRGAGSNIVDYKGGVRNINMHHNIIEDQTVDHNGNPGDGLVRSSQDTGPGNRFDNNIVRNSLSRYIIRLLGRVDVQNNVFYNIDAGQFITGTVSSAIITGNTLCDTPTSGNRGNNNLNAPQSACDAEVARILSEMKSLPGPGAGLTPGTPAFTPGPCNRITAAATPPTPYGAPYNVLSPQKELLVAVVCEADKTVLTIGNGNQGNPSQNYQGLTYVWHKAYSHGGTAWTETTLSCPAPLIANGWCPAKATADLPTDAAWTVGYTCTWWNGTWQCGCTDVSCSTSFWQIQGINR